MLSILKFTYVVSNMISIPFLFMAVCLLLYENTMVYLSTSQLAIWVVTILGLFCVNLYFHFLG